MTDSEELTALKKAYADIILNTAKEAAARIMVSERKAQRFQLGAIASVYGLVELLFGVWIRPSLIYPSGLVEHLLCDCENDCDRDNCFVCNPDFASIVMRSKEPELYRNGCTQRIRAFERHLLGRNLPLSGQADGVKNQIFIGVDEEDKDMCKQLTAKIDNICDVEKEKSPDVDEDDRVGIPRRPRRKRAARYRRHRECKSFPHQAVVNNVQTKEEYRTIDNISQKDPVPIASSKSPLSTSEMITQSVSVEVAESELEFDRTCSFRNTNSNKLSIDELELTVQDIEYAESSEFPVSKTDFGIASVLLSNSNPKEPDATDAAPAQSMSNKFLKYTFQRKRKRKLPSSPDGDSSLNNGIFKRKMGEKQSSSMESLESSMITESSRDNQRMAQVACQVG
ncbi:hypothetical protein GH714_022223 [Hevea brasiliensis]|uniref:Uncharacterized protein n=1 Tax=Hevea brasiliensis TaxID=3981 RepID=A0A6A6MCA4_HEVBR|nr:hypothetical protein GH714_022223 [Hevea brasiliensis]